MITTLLHRMIYFLLGLLSVTSSTYADSHLGNFSSVVSTEYSESLYRDASDRLKVDLSYLHQLDGHDFVERVQQIKNTFLYLSESSVYTSYVGLFEISEVFINTILKNSTGH